MVKYQQYDDFKESFLVWMGNVPKHWKINKFKWMFKEKTKTLNPSLPAGSISFGNVIYKNEKNLSPDTKASYQEVLNGEYLINPLNLNFDLKSLRTALSQIDVVVSTGYIVLIDNGKFNKQYLRWLLYEFDVAHMKKLGSGVRQTINYTDIANSLFFHPELKEQAQIANFLDYETAQIDTLIEKQQTLIQLLKEKRQAVISHAVTKGLNPDAPMKDSGVEWLGGIPSNWSVGALKYWADIIDCKHITAEFVEDGYPLASISEVKEWTVNLSTSKFTTKKYYLELIENGRKPVIGDILYSRNATVGEAALVIDDMPDFAMGQDICLIRSNDKILSEYIMYVLNSGIIKKQLDLAMVGSTFKRINVDNIRNFDISFPSLYSHCTTKELCFG